MLGFVDGLFFQPSSYQKAVLGISLGREDLYYASLTLAAIFVSLAIALAMEIGSKQKPDAVRFFVFTVCNLAFFSIWLWAMSWMLISPTMASGVDRPLDLWRFGPLVIWTSTFEFPAIIAASFFLHAGLLYLTLRKNLLLLK